MRLFSSTPSDFQMICGDHKVLLEILKKGGADDVRRVFREKLEIFRLQNLEGARLFESVAHSDLLASSGPDAPTQ